jgi:hypothetical protein
MVHSLKEVFPMPRVTAHLGNGERDSTRLIAVDREF